jgi:lipopolysaccharide export system protein LptC
VAEVKLAAARMFPLLLMLALALLTFWLERTVREEGGHPSLRRHDPDYFVENFRVLNYNQSGAVESSLTARKMLHYPDDDSTELDLPHLIETRTGQPRTDVSAMRGVLSQDGEEVFLYGNVVLEREATDARSAMRVETSELQYARSRSMARSERDVRIIEERQMISGRGMEYDLDAERIALRERVRARVEPKKQNP